VRKKPIPRKRAGTSSGTRDGQRRDDSRGERNAARERKHRPFPDSRGQRKPVPGITARAGESRQGCPGAAACKHKDGPRGQRPTTALRDANPEPESTPSPRPLGSRTSTGEVARNYVEGREGLAGQFPGDNPPRCFLYLTSVDGGVSPGCPLQRVLMSQIDRLSTGSLSRQGNGCQWLCMSGRPVIPAGGVVVPGVQSVSACVKLTNLSKISQCGVAGLSRFQPPTPFGKAVETH
jgi:hypothetical protein